MNLSKILSIAVALALANHNAFTIADPHEGGGKGKGGDFEFAMERGGKQEGKGGRGGFGLQKAGGRLQLCPTGDCKQSVIDIAMERLIEVDANGNLTENRAKNFKTMDFVWSAPNTTLNEQGVNVTTSSFEALVPIGDVNVTYKAQVAFYAQNGTALNGNQVIDVPAGGLKFAVWIENWPFLSDENKLRLGLRVMTRNKKGEGKPKAAREKGKGRDKLIERMNLGDSMFLDSPVLAEIDQSMQNISSYAAASPEGDFVMVEYEFPKFKKLFYDPVVSSEEALETSTIRSSAGTVTGAVKVSLGAMALTTAMLMMM